MIIVGEFRILDTIWIHYIHSQLVLDIWIDVDWLTEDFSLFNHTFIPIKKSTIIDSIIYIGFLILLGVGVGCIRYRKYQNAEWILCKKAVLSELKSPRIAEIGGASTYSIFPIYWTVHSQNSFWALVKSDFRCSLENSMIIVDWL